MNDIDDQIRQALHDEDEKTLKQLEPESGLTDMIASSFKGKQAWMTIFMWVEGIIALVVTLYFLSRYFAADDLKTSLSWALAIIAGMMVLVILKVVSWMQMQKLEIIREIKRLELRVMTKANSAD